MASDTRSAGNRLDNRQVNGQQNRDHDSAHDDKDRRLKRGRQLLKAYFGFRVIEHSDFVEHLTQTSRALADADHVQRQEWQPASRFEALCERPAFTYKWKDRRTTPPQF